MHFAGINTHYSMRNPFSLQNSRKHSLLRCEYPRKALIQPLLRVLRLGSLLGFYVLLLSGYQAFSQENLPKNLLDHRIDSVVVELATQRAILGKGAAAVRVVPASELQLPSVLTLPDLLAAIPELDIRARGIHGVQADLSVRGGGFDQVLLLLNGVDFTDAQTGHHNLNLPVRPEAIDYIEILTPSGARLYGPGAFAGAINIVTKQAKPLTGQLKALAGQYGLTDAALTLAHQAGRLGVTGFAGTTHSAGYMANTDFHRSEALVTTDIQTNLGHVSVQAGFQTKDFGANAFYTPKFPEQYESTHAIIGSLRYSGRIGLFTFDAVGGYRNHKDRFELFRHARPSWYKGDNYHSTNLYEGRLLVDARMGIAHTTLSLNARHDEILSTNLGESISRWRAIRGVSGFGYTHFASRTTISIAAQEAIQWRGLSASAGISTTQNSSFDFISGYGVDLAYLFPTNIKLYLAVNRAYRLPTFTDLYYSSATQQGNSSLKPEYSLTYEMGAQYTAGRLSANLSGYYRQGRDIIDWALTSPTSNLWRASNRAEVDAYGVEVAGSYYPDLRWVKSLQASYSYMQISSPNTSPAASYTLDKPDHQANIQLTTPAIYGFAAVLAGHYSHRRGHYVDFTSGATREYPHALSIDLRLSYTYRWITLFGQAENLLNAKRIDFGNIPLPGRWVSGGLECRFGE